MRQLRYIASLAIMLLAALPIQAQTENQAFYIYQNDGHFDGFFYDEIEKMSFSFLDTLGVEHDEIVSQEIFTADSVYRIMLSAIDSIGFVQPEVILNKRMFRWDCYDLDPTTYPNMERDMDFLTYLMDWPEEYDCLFSSEMPVDKRPQVGDVFVDFGLKYYNGFAFKVESIKETAEGLAVHLKDIDDITDILEQFVCVEEYGEDEQGNMVRRRVSGRPDLTVGVFPKKSSTRRAEGILEGDIFNFSINGYLPLAGDDDLSAYLMPSIEGKLHVKTVWNLSLFGDKHIGIDTNLDFGIGLGFVIDGKIADYMSPGLGNFASIPVPASFPLFFIKVGPDPFIRGDAHIKFALQTPKAKSSIWTKLEINNWVPSFDMGFGAPKSPKEEPESPNTVSATLSFSGFLQAGVLMPITFESMPTIQRWFKLNLGGRWFLGPKIGADFSLDLTKMPWDDDATYKQLKNIKFQLHLLDADFEVKNTVKLGSGKEKSTTLFDGSFNILPTVEAKLVPEFGACSDYIDQRMIEGQLMKCRVLSFKPSGYVIKPTYIGTYLKNIDYEDRFLGSAKYSYVPYYHLAEMMGTELDKSHWAELVIPIHEGQITRSSFVGGKYKVTPTVFVPGMPGDDQFVIADPAYTFEYGIAELKTNSDTIFTTYDGITIYPIIASGVHNKIMRDDYGYFDITDDDLIIVSSDIIKFNSKHKIKNFNPRDPMTLPLTHYVGANEYEGEIFVSDPHYFSIQMAPNNQDVPVAVRVSDDLYLEYLYYDYRNWKWNITFADVSTVGYGWHFEGRYNYDNEIQELVFDIVLDENSSMYSMKNGTYSYKQMKDNKVIKSIEETISCRPNETVEQDRDFKDGYYKNFFETSGGKHSSIYVYFQEALPDNF